MPAKVDTHKERQDATITASLALLSQHPFNEVLTAEEERGLAAALPSLRTFAADMGVLETPLSNWTRENVMRFLALAVRSAVPLRALPDHEAFRVLSDEIPF